MPPHSEQTSRLDKLSGLPMSSPDWAALEKKVTELVDLCAVLSRENRALRTQQQNWTTERAKLIEKNELAKSRVESMITRLKALEQD
jgi:cell division protein ZapB